jgi:hypothetical protein
LIDKLHTHPKVSHAQQKIILEIAITQRKTEKSHLEALPTQSINSAIKRSIKTLK